MSNEVSEKERTVVMSKEILESIEKSLYEKQEKPTTVLVQEALDSGYSALEIIDALNVGITELGQRFEKLEVFLPELIMGGNSMQASMEILMPELEKNMDTDQIEKSAKIVLGNLEGDIHDIGRDIFTTMLRVAGFEVVNIGNNVKADTFIDTAEETGADVIALSSLLTTSLPFARDLMGLLEARNLQGKYIVIIGGGAATKEFADSIGAEYGTTAVNGVDVIKDLVANR